MKETKYFKPNAESVNELLKTRSAEVDQYLAHSISDAVANQNVQAWKATRSADTSVSASTTIAFGTTAKAYDQIDAAPKEKAHGITFSK